MSIGIMAILLSTILGANRNAGAGGKRNRGSDWFSDDWWAIPHDFTREDHKAAQEDGFYDAFDEQKWIQGRISADLGREKMKRMSRAQVALDLEGEGLSQEEIGELSDETIHLPLNPEYEAEHRIHTRMNNYERRAHVAGMCNRLIDVKNRLAKYGLSLDMSPDEVPDKHRDVYQWAEHEYMRLAERLAAFGEKIEEIEQGMDEGEITKKDFVDAPDDAELSSGRSRSSAPASTTYGHAQKQFASGQATDTGDTRAASRGTAPTASPRIHLKEHEIAMMRERLSEIGEQMRDLGYDGDAALEEVSAQDRGLVRQLIHEREVIGRDLAELCADIDEIEREMDEEKVQHESEDIHEDAREPLEEDDDANEDAGTEEVQEDASANTDEGADVDSWSGSGDGWQEMFE